MDAKKKYLIFVYSFLFIVLCVVVFFVIKSFILNKKNDNNSVVVNKNNSVYTEEFFKDVQEKVEKAKTLKSYESVDNIKLCDYKKDCIKDILKNCTKGFGLFVIKRETDILNVNKLADDNVCDFYVANTDEKGSIYCHIKKEELTENLVNKIIELGSKSDFLVSDYKCTVTK